MTGPDKNVHPMATGVAKKTVDAHQEKQDIVFWSAWFCPFNQRIWMALEERNIPYQYHEVNPYKKQSDFLSVNPLGLVPAIETHGGSLYESDVMLEYLEDLFPDSDKHPSIFPRDVFQKSWARLNIQHITKNIIPHYFGLQQAQTDDKQREARNDLYEGLRVLVERVKLPYFAGSHWTAVDMSLAPFVRRFYVLEQARKLRVREQLGEKWGKYEDGLLGRESLRMTSSEDKYYTEILDRYLRNEAQSEVAKATREKKKLP